VLALTDDGWYVKDPLAPTWTSIVAAEMAATEALSTVAMEKRIF